MSQVEGITSHTSKGTCICCPWKNKIKKKKRRKKKEEYNNGFNYFHQQMRQTYHGPSGAGRRNVLQQEQTDWPLEQQLAYNDPVRKWDKMMN